MKSKPKRPLALELELKLELELELKLKLIASQTQSGVDQATAINPHLVMALERVADEGLLCSRAGGFGECAAATGKGRLKSARQLLGVVCEDELQLLYHEGRPDEPDYGKRLARDGAEASE